MALSTMLLPVATSGCCRSCGQKVYALPETVRFGLTQMLRPNEMNGVTYANVLHSLFVETDRHAEVHLRLQ